jgi:RNA polymerase sigma factor (TIGR02999 family)
VTQPRTPHASVPGEITHLLLGFQAGDAEATARLVDRIYPELKRIARAQLRRERSGHAPQPTVLVHEAYLRLVGHTAHTWQNRGHFFAAAANTMRRILIEEARARGAVKRRGAGTSIPLEDNVPMPSSQPEELLDLDQALGELEQLSPRQARVVELRYFAGLSVPEIAAALGLNPRSVDRDWAAARAWLRLRLSA